MMLLWLDCEHWLLYLTWLANAPPSLIQNCYVDLSHGVHGPDKTQVCAAM